ncbi:MAG TPA: Rne/Rng family ribonuclease [Caulobacteraceae bacterium]|nr:Rne/Rng family ribonuclease [Caulobacteraceae bacterium]
MASKMLIDASHPEETRVVVMRGNRVEEFDFESANRKQLRGNIYLAKVTRVEPSLQAAFVDYGGNRHGFLAFSEIHPDYYQIPIADRQALLAAQERDERDAEAEAERRAGRRWRGRGRNARRRDEKVRSDTVEAHAAEGEQPQEFNAQQNEAATDFAAHDTVPPATHDHGEHDHHDHEHAAEHEASEEHLEHAAHDESHDEPPADLPTSEAELPAVPPEVEAVTENHDGQEAAAADTEHTNSNGDEHHEDESVESVGGADALEEVQERMPRVRARQYKIQEVIKRRQVTLVQVVKEERGTKGAALTTYLSLAGRYSVLMPNTSRGGGISRKITSSEDRSRLKEIAQELEVPEGMGVILRTAGASRTKLEVKRDFEYLLRIWEQVRDLTLKSTAPKLVYEEGSLVKRSIRDLYSKDIDEIVVAGEQGYNDAKEFMRMLMPSHAKNVKLYRDSQPVFTRFGIESQLDAMFTPTVQLKSGGYIVINQTEALVAIDVNSGRATREHSIEDTATKTNSEAADEIARQLRLRDLAGLIVIDFIDMDEAKNNRAVEKKLKDCLKDDRARIQMGKISQFGLMEISRQRRRSGVLEGTTLVCPHCQGVGRIRSVESSALSILRDVEMQAVRQGPGSIVLRTPAEVALYILNEKRAYLLRLQQTQGLQVAIQIDETLGEAGHQIERLTTLTEEEARAFTALLPAPEPEADDDFDIVDEDEDEDEALDLSDEDEEEVEEEENEGGRSRARAPERAPDADGEGARSGRRRRRRRGRRDDQDAPRQDDAVAGSEAGHPGEDDGEGEVGEDGRHRRRRRGRRGGRRAREDVRTADAYGWTRIRVPHSDGVYTWFDPALATASQPRPAPAEGAAPSAQVRQPEPQVARPPQADSDIWVELPPSEPARPGRSRRGRGRGRGAEAPAAEVIAEVSTPAFEPAPDAQPAEVVVTEVQPEPEAAKPAAKPRRSRAKAPAPVEAVDTIAPPEPVIIAAPEPEPALAEPDPAEISSPPSQPKRGWWRRT